MGLVAFFIWGLAGTVAVVLPLGLVVVLVHILPSFSTNQDENPNIKLNKNQKYPRLMQQVSLMCSWHMCSDK